MWISVLQVITAIALIVLILLQERTSGLSGVFGGEIGGGFYQARRGLEKTIFSATIALIVVFVALSIAQLYF